MKCCRCAFTEWVVADIADELATYNRKTKTYSILLDCPKCRGTMKWHNHETEIKQWESSSDLDDLPF